MNESPAASISPQQRCNAQRWLLLAVGAMALSAILAILLVLSRTPGVQELLGLQAAFHTVLVLHVNFAVLVWLLAFGGVLWSLHLEHHAPLRDGLAFGLAVSGALLLLAAPWATGAAPVMSNYIPVLDTPLFLTGLIGFATGLSLLAAAAMPSRNLCASPAALAALAWFAALALFAAHAVRLMTSAPVSYEQIFWGGGHLLQVVYLLLLLTVWQQKGAPLPVSSAATTFGLLLVALVVGLTFDPASRLSHTAFTRLMQFGMPLLLFPVLWRMVRDKTNRGDVAVVASVRLMMLGLLAGLLINSDSVIVTAHYHATNAAITAAFMGAAYGLLPRLGLAELPIFAQRWQLRLYAGGMSLYVAGMAASGLLGVPRKSAVVIEGDATRLAMAVMGLGGLIAVVATLLFVVLMFAAMRRPAAIVLKKAMGEMS